ncbi:MAG: IclR family transcriptional regulator [Novosphingobium sp.]|nr:IclR family transcriptional regulator [Novosphingobium sp.]
MAQATKKPARKGVQSIEVGFSILAVLTSAARPLPLKTISQMSGLPPSKVHSYLVSFTALDVVTQHSDTGHYGLGPVALKLGLAFLDQFDLFSATRPAMAELADGIGVTVFLGVWGNRGPTIIYRADGPLSETVLDIRVGSVLPILRSAVGRNLAAHMPDSIIRPLVAQELSHFMLTGTADTIDDPHTLMTAEKMFEKVRADGISRVRGGLVSDYSALSVPIFDYSGAAYGALTIMGRYNSFDDSLNGDAAIRLKTACASISATCGYSPAPKV